MTENDLERHPEWPKDQFHPAYDSFTAWLDSEAPAKAAEVKKRNQPRYKRTVRRTT